MFGSIIFCPRWDQAAQVKSQSISGTAFMWDDLNVSLLPCATAIIMAAQTPVLLFPQAQNQLLICTKPWALNPSQTLNNALRVGPHRGRVTLLSPDRGRTFSSPPPIILFYLFSTTWSQLFLLFDLPFSSPSTGSSKYDRKSKKKQRKIKRTSAMTLPFLTDIASN